MIISNIIIISKVCYFHMSSLYHKRCQNKKIQIIELPVLAKIAELAEIVINNEDNSVITGKIIEII